MPFPSSFLANSSFCAAAKKKSPHATKSISNPLATLQGEKKDSKHLKKKQDTCNEVKKESNLIVKPRNPSIPDVHASREMCVFCFDSLLHHLLTKKKKKAPLLHCDSTNTHTYHMQKNKNEKKSKKRSLVYVDNGRYRYEVSLLTDRLHHTYPWLTTRRPLFVTWDERKREKYSKVKHSSKRQRQPDNDDSSFRLRGCIGNMSALSLNELAEYAITAGTKDSRFRPIQLVDIPSLRVSVSLLGSYERCRRWNEWEVDTHGILIKFKRGTLRERQEKAKERLQKETTGDENTTSREIDLDVDEDSDTTDIDEDSLWSSSRYEYSATYLPGVVEEQNWDRSESLYHLIQKAGFDCSRCFPKKISSKHLEKDALRRHEKLVSKYLDETFVYFKVIRYRSSKYKLSFDEYSLLES